MVFFFFSSSNSYLFEIKIVPSHVIFQWIRRKKKKTIELKSMNKNLRKSIITYAFPPFSKRRKRKEATKNDVAIVLIAFTHTHTPRERETERLALLHIK